VPSLRALVDSGADVAAVVTNPDRPAGRGYDLSAPPVKLAAVELGIEVVQPKSARDPEFEAWLREVDPDVCAVVAYGKILPKAVLDIPRWGFVNLHFSLLPKYRGAAPVQRAVMEGDDVTGVAIMVLTEGMDEGPVLSMTEVAIDPEETAGELGDRLARIGGPLLADTLENYVAGRLEPQEQDHSAATYAPKITSDEARIDWERTAKEIVSLVRGLNPAPGAWTTWGDVRLKVHQASVTSGSGTPGAVLDPQILVVAAGEDAVRLDVVQPAGKKQMEGAVFSRGARLPDDATLG
jgi:methionyl-tRNA formyltransferase